MLDASGWEYEHFRAADVFELSSALLREWFQHAVAPDETLRV